MTETRKFSSLVRAALVLTVIVILFATGSPASGKGQVPVSTGPTPQDCFSARYHAASDCDRLATGDAYIPITGARPVVPTVRDCYSARFHAATDCDRLASQRFSARLAP